MMRTPLLPRDARARLALWASIIGAAVLIIFAATVVGIVWRGGWAPSTDGDRLTTLARTIYIALGGALVVLISLGLAINRREIRVSRDGFEVSGGDDPDPQAAATVTTTTEVR